MTQIQLLVDAGLDFMEISGGSYEDPQMMQGDSQIQEKSARTAAREAFFLEFAQEVRKRHAGLVLMLTGGFRSRVGAESAVRDGACDLVGVGRPAVVCPGFASLLLDEGVSDEEAVVRLNKVVVPWYVRLFRLSGNLVGAGAETVSTLVLSTWDSGREANG